MPTSLRLAAVLVPLASLACARVDAAPTSAGTVQESTSEDDLAALRALRDEISKDVERLRGLEFKGPVDVAVRSKEQFLEYMLERNDRFLSDEQADADETVAKLLGLVPLDMDVIEAMMALVGDQAAGYYEPSEDTFYVMDGAGTGDLLRIVLAHELTHALDDQHFDIDGTLLPLVRENADAAGAFHAVVEGSGTSIMNVWAMPKAVAGELSADDMEAAGGQDFGDAPEFLWKPLLHSYLRGAAFLSRTDNAMMGQMSVPDNGDIDRAFRDPPKSTEQILHPDKYWNPKRRDDPVAVAIGTSALPAGWEVRRQDTLGELLLALVTTPPDSRQTFGSDPMAALSLTYTNEAAKGWGGDRYVLLVSGDERVFHHVTVWDTPADATEFAGALDALEELLTERATWFGDGDGAFRVRREPDGARVELTAWGGLTEDAADAVLATLDTSVTPPAPRD